MKKNVLALSIAVGLLGLAGGAHAVTDPGIAAVVGSKLVNNVDGIGHILLVPYFTSQAANSTLINIVNSDTINAKAVKVRFRGAANSDDIFDFQVFLSPGDVWAASVSRGADGRSILTTVDNSCTKPSKATLNATPFVTARLDSALTGDALAAQTREGYVEILNMADILPATTLFTAVKHVGSVAPCGAAFTALDLTVDTNTAGWNALGLTAPTTGLLANWTIINTVGASSWSGTADTVEARNAAGIVPVAGNMVYWPQTSTPVAAGTANFYTADPLIRTDGQTPNGGTATIGSTPAFAAGFYDFPDLSTPYTAAAGVTTDGLAPLRQALSQTAAIAAVSVTNEYLTVSTIAATTDWTFSMPTRRYSVAMNYAALTAGTEGRRFSELVDDGAGNATLTTGYFTAANTVVSNRQICVTGITQNVYDREENSPTSSTSVVVSPSSPGVPTSFCGEASVLSFNNAGAASTGSLRATVAFKDVTVPYADGWMVMSTPSASGVAGVVPGTATPATPRGLPLLGQAFARAIGGTGGQTFGASWGHRLGR